MTEDKKYAILIDVENIPAVWAAEIFDETSALGRFTYRRAYVVLIIRNLLPRQKNLLNTTICIECTGGFGAHVIAVASPVPKDGVYVYLKW